ncbi:MAG: DUF371 domain-containing protein [Thermoproteota archaeon]|nr:DUF371 domain-containing protein [Thermoproteota archaeon]
MIQDEVTFYGHQNIKLLHLKSIEITKDDHLTPKGDCIMGIKASKSCADLSEPVKHRLKSNLTVATIEVMVGNERLVIKGKGDFRLTLLHSHDIVLRKTNFVCPRTLSVQCDKASSEVPRNLVAMLQDPEIKGIFRITVD